MSSACSPDSWLYYNGVSDGRSGVMSTESLDTKGLHLPDLVINGFRGIEDLTVSRLGRVNLISGRNGVGKTSLLEAVRVYASRGHYYVLADILGRRDELTRATGEDGAEFFAPNLECLFYGRTVSSETHMTIGPGGHNPTLNVKVAPLSEEYLSQRDVPSHERILGEDSRALMVEFQDGEQEIPFSRILQMDRIVHPRIPGLTRSGESDIPAEVVCEILGPDLLSNRDIARFWDRVALTDGETRSVEALNLIFDDRVERVAVVGDDSTSRHIFGGRRVVVRLKNEKSPVPLMSLGDGAARLFGVALALANSKDGFLLIDEVENGIHYSLQFDFWKMVMKAAHENNVQVFATTHSWDCVRGFAWAASETEEVEGALIRLFNKGGKVKAVEYSERDLKIAAEQGIELR